MNRIQVIGRSGAKAELRYTQSGMAVLELSLADSRKVKEEYVTQWIRCICWGKTAEKIAPLIQKGTEVVVMGQLEIREYTDKNQLKRTAVQVNVEWIRACVRGEVTERDAEWL